MSTLKAYRQKPNSKLVSVDIPSGWDVNEGYDPQSNALMPDCLISLTAPKLCAQHLESNLQHWICNHFVPKTLKDKYGLTAPVKSGEITWQLNETIA